LGKKRLASGHGNVIQQVPIQEYAWVRGDTIRGGDQVDPGGDPKMKKPAGGGNEHLDIGG